MNHPPTHPRIHSACQLRLKVAVAGGLALAVLVGWVLVRDHAPATVAARPSVARSNLVMRAGKWYSLHSTNLFTGWMVEFYPDGSRQSRSAIASGLLNGVCESWHPNGELQMREHFKNSVSDGPRESWYSNGQRKSEATVVDGALEGTFRRWYDNGQLAEQIDMEKGQPDGLAWAYYRSGFAKAETHVSAGRVLSRKVWKDGENKVSE